MCYGGSEQGTISTKLCTFLSNCHTIVILLVYLYNNHRVYYEAEGVNS